MQSARHVRRWAFLVIATLFVLPTLVRATQPLAFSDNATSSIRLNRGFDAPQSKCDAPSPNAVARTSDERLPDTRERADYPAAQDEILPHSQLVLQPEGLRGPPVLRFLA